MSRLNSDSHTFSETSNSNMYGSDQLPWHPPNFISYLEWVEVSVTVTNVESSCHNTCSNGKTWPWCWLTQENQDQGNWEDRGTKKDQKNEKGRKAKETFEGMIFPAQTGKASQIRNNIFFKLSFWIPHEAYKPYLMPSYSGREVLPEMSMFKPFEFAILLNPRNCKRSH